MGKGSAIELYNSQLRRLRVICVTDKCNWFLFFDKTGRGFIKSDSGLARLSQPPQVSNTLKCLPAALTCKKNINDCPGAVLNFKVYAGQSIIFFSLMLKSGT